MSMKRTLRGVSYLIENELDMAQEKHGETFASMHEGESALREEIEEAVDEMEAVGRLYHCMWDDIKEEDAKSARLHAEDIAATAERLAAEVIQVAAMALKFVETVDRMEDENADTRN